MRPARRSGWCRVFFFQAEDGIRDKLVTGVQTCALPIFLRYPHATLKGPSSSVDPGAGAIALAADLIDTMRASPACVGIAAPQIGVGARAFCRSEERRVGEGCRWLEWRYQQERKGPYRCR